MAVTSGAVVAPDASQPSPSMGLVPMRALARRAFRDARIRTLSFACLFGVYSYVQPLAYREGYPTLSSRLAFARSFANNKAIRLFYGEPHDLLTVNGYAAWRVGGTLAIFAAIFGLLAAVRALRTEEDTGRMELVLAGPIARRTAYLVCAGRDRGWHLDPVVRRVRWLPRRGLAGGRSGVPSAGDGVGHAGVRRRGSDSQPARAHPSDGARAGGRCRRPVVLAAGDRRHRKRYRLAALGDAVGVGGGATTIRRQPTARAGGPGRGDRSAASSRRADRRQPRHRHRSAPDARKRRAAAAAALLAYRTGAAQRARQLDYLA